MESLNNYGKCVAIKIMVEKVAPSEEEEDVEEARVKDRTIKTTEVSSNIMNVANTGTLHTNA